MGEISWPSDGKSYILGDHACTPMTLTQASSKWEHQCILVQGVTWKEKKSYKTEPDVSETSGTPPKSSILTGFSIIFTIHVGGFSPYFWKHRSTHKQVHPPTGPVRWKPPGSSRSSESKPGSFLAKKNTESQAFLFLRDWLGWSFPFQKKISFTTQNKWWRWDWRCEIEDIKSGQACELMAKHE